MTFIQIVALIGILLCLGLAVWCSIEEELYRKRVDKRLKSLENKGDK